MNLIRKEKPKKINAGLKKLFIILIGLLVFSQWLAAEDAYEVKHADASQRKGFYLSLPAYLYTTN